MMVTYISAGDLRRLQRLSRHRDESSPAENALTLGGGPLDASCAPPGSVRQIDSNRLRSFHAYLRRERRFAIHRLKQALTELRGKEEESSSTTDAAEIIAAAELIASEETAPEWPTRKGVEEEEKSEISSVGSTLSSTEGNDEEDLSSEEGEERGRGPRRKDVEKKTQEAQEKLRGELAYMRMKIPELLQRKKYADAEKLLGYYLQLFPRLPQLYLFGHQIYVGQRRYADAIDMCWAGLFCAPGNAVLTRSLSLAEELLAQQATRIPQRYKAALFNFSGAFLQAMRDKEREASRLRYLGEGRFMTVQENDRLRCIANCSLEPGDLVFKERPYVATPMLLFEELDFYNSASTSSNGGNHSWTSSPASSGNTFCNSSSSSNRDSAHLTLGSDTALRDRRRRRLRLFTTCFHCLQERRIPDRGFACTESPYTCPFVFCSWECLLRNGRVHAKECSVLPFVLAAAKEAHLSPTSVLHFFRFLMRAGLERDQGIPALRGGASPAAAAGALPSGRVREGSAELDMLDRLLALPSLRDSVEKGQPELYHRICFLMRRVQKELQPQQYCFLKHDELVDAMLVLLQRSPILVSGSTAAALSRRDPAAAVGLAYSAATAMLSHSCIPTCCVDFSEDGELAARSICNIPVGGSLCISMVQDLFEPTSRRKHQYALPCVFACGCSRCADPAEDNRNLRGVRCPACNRGYCNPNKSTALLLRLRAYSSSGSQGTRMYYWQKIWTEQQQKYTRRLALISQKQLQGEQQQEFKEMMNQRYWRTGKTRRRKERDVDLGEEDEDGVHPMDVRELLRQVEAGPDAAARAFAEDDPYAILSEVMHEHQVQSHVLATLAARHMKGKNEPGATEPKGRELTSVKEGAAHEIGGVSSHPFTATPFVHAYSLTSRSSFLNRHTAFPSPETALPSPSSGLSPGSVPGTATEDMWQCNFCGRASVLLSAQCSALEKRVTLLAEAAAVALQQGKPLPARALLQVLIDRYSVVLHPHHWRLYDAHVVAAGLYLSQPQQQLQLALLYMRRAMSAASAVLPVCYREKALLYTKLAELEFTCMQQQKLVNRTAAIPPPAVVLEPLYAALHNATVCCGSNSALALTCMHRIRIYAGALGRATPPLAFSLRLRPIPAFLTFYRRLFGRGAGSDEQIKRMVEEDPFQVAAAITRRGFCDDIAIDLLKTFNDIYHLPSGLSPIALAAAACHIPLVKRMLQSGHDFLAANEWGVTPLLAMAARPLPAAPVASSGSISTSYCSFPHNAEAAAADSDQASLLRLFLRACDERDAAAASPGAAAFAAAAKRLSAGAKEAESSVKSAGDGQEGRAGAAVEKKTTDMPISVVYYASPSERSGFKTGTSYRELLLEARTHRLLGLNGVFHLAAARGKKELCKQLLRLGQSLFAANAEGATPLHLAALGAHVSTVQALLDYAVASLPSQPHTANRTNAHTAIQRLINVRTERGETPLMLAAYGLQRETVSLLLQRGADVNAVAHREQLTALHALAIGICRDYEVQQQPLDLRGDAGAATLLGLNDYSLSAGIYSRGRSSPISPAVCEDDQQDIVDMRVPLVSRLPHDLLFFPDQILWRLKEALHIAQQLLNAPCSSKTLAHVCRSGYTAEQLLQQLWKQLLHRRASLLLQSEIRLSALSPQERYDIAEGWEEAGKLLFRVENLFVVAQVAAKEEIKERRFELERLASSTSGGEVPGALAGALAEEQEDETPRPEDIAYRRRKQLEREAPWIYFEEQQKQQLEKQPPVAGTDGQKTAAGPAKKADTTAPLEKAISPAEKAKGEMKEMPAKTGAGEQAKAAAKEVKTPGDAVSSKPKLPLPMKKGGPPLPPTGGAKADATPGAPVEKLEASKPPGPPEIIKKDSSAAATEKTGVNAVPEVAPPIAATAKGENKPDLSPPKKLPPKGPLPKLKGPPPPLTKKNA